jgi:hypothetical protein
MDENVQSAINSLNIIQEIIEAKDKVIATQKKELDELTIENSKLKGK